MEPDDMFNDDSGHKYDAILNLIQSHLVDTQNFTNPRKYHSFHHPLLTALPPSTPINPHPTEQLFLILRDDEKVSTRMFAEVFEWVKENVLQEDVEMGGRVKGEWGLLIAAIVACDSTVAYYKVYDGIHKPLEGTAGV